MEIAKAKKECIQDQLYFYVTHIHFKMFSNKAICKQGAANEKQIKTKYRKMPVYSELAV